MKQGIHDVLSDEDKWPKELIFVGRNTRIVQGDDQCLGSPVKWVKVMGEWACRILFEDPTCCCRSGYRTRGGTSCSRRS